MTPPTNKQSLLKIAKKITELGEKIIQESDSGGIVFEATWHNSYLLGKWLKRHYSSYKIGLDANSPFTPSPNKYVFYVAL